MLLIGDKIPKFLCDPIYRFFLSDLNRNFQVVFLFIANLKHQICFFYYFLFLNDAYNAHPDRHLNKHIHMI